MIALLFGGLTDGAWNLFWMYLWLVSSMSASYISERKGYSDRAGLATGLCLTILGPIIWLVVPAKPESKWKQLGPWGRQQRAEVAAKQ